MNTTNFLVLSLLKSCFRKPTGGCYLRVHCIPMSSFLVCPLYNESLDLTTSIFDKYRLTADHMKPILSLGNDTLKPCPHSHKSCILLQCVLWIGVVGIELWEPMAIILLGAMSRRWIIHWIFRWVKWSPDPVTTPAIVQTYKTWKFGKKKCSTVSEQAAHS